MDNLKDCIIRVVNECDKHNMLIIIYSFISNLLK